jgi:hypothetical protein
MFIGGVESNCFRDMVAFDYHRFLHEICNSLGKVPRPDFCDVVNSSSTKSMEGATARVCTVAWKRRSVVSEIFAIYSSPECVGYG